MSQYLNCCVTGAYPRRCGEHSNGNYEAAMARGLPPQVRGARIDGPYGP